MTRTVRRRAFAFTAAFLFALSWVSPLLQGLVREEVDKQAKETTYRFYRISMHAILAVSAVVMLAGDRIAWASCATGFLWRIWLLLYILAWWLAAARRPEVRPSP